MRDIILVGAGGGLGAVLRLQLSGWISRTWLVPTFPFGTACVNLTGCLVIGILAGVAERSSFLNDDLRLLLLTGLLGGFTTFSAFGIETFLLIRQEQIVSASIYVLTSVLGGLLLVWLGYRLVTS